LFWQKRDPHSNETSDKKGKKEFGSIKETTKKEKEMILKKEYEMTFKEGFRLGMRLTRAKAYIENARDAKETW
jgi:hypothetical protein